MKKILLLVPTVLGIYLTAGCDSCHLRIKDTSGLKLL